MLKLIDGLPSDSIDRDANYIYFGWLGRPKMLIK
jgi:hypothetical protein